MELQSIGEIVRKAESDYISGPSDISEYVQFSLRDTVERIYAYIHSKHITGETDSLGREKPFFNICTAAVNVWFRATDIDRSNIRVRATKSTDWIDAFLATVHLQEWMRRERFGSFLNEWGRVLARFGSAVVKFVKNQDGLHISVVPWSNLIVDPVNFDQNKRIEVLELTLAQLNERVQTHGYDQAMVDALAYALTSRETLSKQKKDNKNDYIKVYEIHGVFPKWHLTSKESDKDIYVQQMHVISFVGIRQGRKTEYQDFTLYAGEEAEDPYMLTTLIAEDGRVLGIGAVEHLFEAQWMQNHSVKAVKDHLDIASKMIFQTSDPTFSGRNILTDMEQGTLFIHSINQPVTQVNNQSHDITQWQNYAVQWKTLGNEITGISEAMLGAQPKSGTAWRQTEALLSESYSLFELMTENKAHHIEDMLRQRIIPYLKTKMDTSEEISSTLQQHDIDVIDALYLKHTVTDLVNKAIKDRMLKGEPVSQEEQMLLMATSESELREMLRSMGNQRFFKVDDVGDKTWKEQFKDLEWDLEIDITGEARNTQEALTTLNTALKLVMTPGFEQNKKAQALISRVLELSGAMSPIEYNAIPASPVQAPEAQQPLPVA